MLWPLTWAAHTEPPMVSNTATAARQWPPKSCFFPGPYTKSSVTLDTRVSEVYFQASQDNMLRLVYFSKKMKTSVLLCIPSCHTQPRVEVTTKHKIQVLFKHTVFRLTHILWNDALWDLTLDTGARVNIKNILHLLIIKQLVQGN